MAEIINLRRARKAIARNEQAAKADQNRIAFGRTKAERKLTEAERDLANRRIDGHLRQGDAKSDADE